MAGSVFRVLVGPVHQRVENHLVCEFKNFEKRKKGKKGKKERSKKIERYRKKK